MLTAAVDVGSARARAGIFSPEGRLLARTSRPFGMVVDSDGRPGYAFAEIWDAVATALPEAIALAGAAPGDVAALAFDATCSLFVDAPGFTPDVIAWHDHRATAEAAELSATGHPVARRAGGRVSPEMQTPKLMWLARHRPAAWAGLRAVRDLADQLAFAATGIDARSANVAAAKWPWLPDAGGWAEDLLDHLGLAALPRAGAVLPVGARIGGVTPAAADRLGLTPGCVVAAGMVDAFAGALGAAPDMPVIIAGTSTCLIAPDLAEMPGVWGPYPGAILPDQPISEGGLSATGAALETIRQMYRDQQRHSDILARIGQSGDPGAGIHLLPDLKGNRTPFADPALRGVIHGVALDRSDPALDALYWRMAVAVALGTRQVARHMGIAADGDLALAGGQARAPLMRQLYADALGAAIHWQPEDAVLRGTAIAAAAERLGGLRAAQAIFARPAQITRPDPQARARRDRDWRIFLRMQEQRAEIDSM